MLSGLNLVCSKAEADTKLCGTVYLDGASEFNHVVREEMKEVSRHERQA